MAGKQQRHAIGDLQRQRLAQSNPFELDIVPRVALDLRPNTTVHAAAIERGAATAAAAANIAFWGEAALVIPVGRHISIIPTRDEISQTGDRLEQRGTFILRRKPQNKHQHRRTTRNKSNKADEKNKHAAASSGKGRDAEQRQQRPAAATAAATGGNNSNSSSAKDKGTLRLSSFATHSPGSYMAIAEHCPETCTVVVEVRKLDCDNNNKSRAAVASASAGAAIAAEEASGRAHMQQQLQERSAVGLPVHIEWSTNANVAHQPLQTANQLGGSEPRRRRLFLASKPTIAAIHNSAITIVGDVAMEEAATAAADRSSAYARTSFLTFRCITRMAFSPNGQYLAMVGDGPKFPFMIWEWAATPARLSAQPIFLNAPVLKLVWHPTHPDLIATVQRAAVQEWTLQRPDTCIRRRGSSSSRSRRGSMRMAAEAGKASVDGVGRVTSSTATATTTASNGPGRGPAAAAALAVVKSSNTSGHMNRGALQLTKRIVYESAATDIVDACCCQLSGAQQRRRHDTGGTVYVIAAPDALMVVRSGSIVQQIPVNDVQGGHVRAVLSLRGNRDDGFLAVGDGFLGRYVLEEDMVSSDAVCEEETEGGSTAGDSDHTGGDPDGDIGEVRLVSNIFGAQSTKRRLKRSENAPNTGSRISSLPCGSAKAARRYLFSSVTTLSARCVLSIPLKSVLSTSAREMQRSGGGGGEEQQHQKKDEMQSDAGGRLGVSHATLSPSARMLAITSRCRQIILVCIDDLELMDYAADARIASTAPYGDTSVMVRRLHGIHTQRVSAMDVCLNRPLIATCSRYDRSVRIFDFVQQVCVVERRFRSRRELKSETATDDSDRSCHEGDGYHHGEAPLAIAIHPHGDVIAVAFASCVRLYRVSVNCLSLCNVLLMTDCQKLKFSNGGQFIAALCRRAVWIVASTTGRLAAVLRGHYGIVTDACWSGNDAFLTTVCMKGGIRKWDILRRLRVSEHDDDAMQYNGVVVGPDGRYAVTGVHSHYLSPGGTLVLQFAEGVRHHGFENALSFGALMGTFSLSSTATVPDAKPELQERQQLDPALDHETCARAKEATTEKQRQHLLHNPLRRVLLPMSFASVDANVLTAMYRLKPLPQETAAMIASAQFRDHGYLSAGMANYVKDTQGYRVNDTIELAVKSFGSLDDSHLMVSPRRGTSGKAGDEEVRGDFIVGGDSYRVPQMCMGVIGVGLHLFLVCGTHRGSVQVFVWPLRPESVALAELTLHTDAICDLHVCQRTQTIVTVSIDGSLFVSSLQMVLATGRTLKSGAAYLTTSDASNAASCVMDRRGSFAVKDVATVEGAKQGWWKMSGIDEESDGHRSVRSRCEDNSLSLSVYQHLHGFKPELFVTGTSFKALFAPVPRALALGLMQHDARVESYFRTHRPVDAPTELWLPESRSAVSSDVDLITIHARDHSENLNMIAELKSKVRAYQCEWEYKIQRDRSRTQRILSSQQLDNDKRYEYTRAKTRELAEKDRKRDEDVAKWRSRIEREHRVAACELEHVYERKLNLEARRCQEIAMRSADVETAMRVQMEAERRAHKLEMDHLRQEMAAAVAIRDRANEALQEKMQQHIYKASAMLNEKDIEADATVAYQSKAVAVLKQESAAMKRNIQDERLTLRGQVAYAKRVSSESKVKLADAETTVAAEREAANQLHDRMVEAESTVEEQAARLSSTDLKLVELEMLLKNREATIVTLKGQVVDLMSLAQRNDKERAIHHFERAVVELDDEFEVKQDIIMEQERELAHRNVRLMSLARDVSLLRQQLDDKKEMMKRIRADIVSCKDVDLLRSKYSIVRAAEDDEVETEYHKHVRHLEGVINVLRNKLANVEHESETASHGALTQNVNLMEIINELRVDNKRLNDALSRARSDVTRLELQRRLEERAWRGGKLSSDSKSAVRSRRVQHARSGGGRLLHPVTMPVTQSAQSSMFPVKLKAAVQSVGGKTATVGVDQSTARRMASRIEEQADEIARLREKLMLHAREDRGDKGGKCNQRRVRTRAKQDAYHAGRRYQGQFMRFPSRRPSTADENSRYVSRPQPLQCSVDQQQKLKASASAGGAHSGTKHSLQASRNRAVRRPVTAKLPSASAASPRADKTTDPIDAAYKQWNEQLMTFPPP